MYSHTHSITDKQYDTVQNRFIQCNAIYIALLIHQIHMVITKLLNLYPSNSHPLQHPSPRVSLPFLHFEIIRFCKRKKNGPFTDFDTTHTIDILT